MSILLEYLISINIIKKYILKDILYKYVPKELLDSKKKGFGIPKYEWLQTFLKEDIERLSTKEFIERQNIFNYEKLSKIINRSDDEIYKDVLWDYYIFQLWYEKYMLSQ
ncbi:MAG: hypothetical protein IJH12_04560 [Clostridia bacterium]|nr:hypothetical protein [Clostridia bacterium]